MGSSQQIERAESVPYGGLCMRILISPGGVSLFPDSDSSLVIADHSIENPIRGDKGPMLSSFIKDHRAVAPFLLPSRRALKWWGQRDVGQRHPMAQHSVESHCPLYPNRPICICECDHFLGRTGAGEGSRPLLVSIG